jgi:aerobic carbon-monoxide dehydrogenase small subunit
MQVTLTVNGTQRDLDVPAGLLLADLLRDELRLTGTKVGCDTGSCGSCLVDVDGRAVKSCTVLAVQAAHTSVTTIEGVAGPGELDRLQAALRTEHGVQCGFCTPGVVMALRELLARTPAPTEAQTRDWLAGNLCRCTGYAGILRAVRSLVPELAGQERS